VTKPSPAGAAADTDSKESKTTKETKDVNDSKKTPADLDPADKPSGAGKSSPSASKAASGSGSGTSEGSSEKSNKSEVNYATIPGVQAAETEFVEKAKQCADGRSAHLCIQAGTRDAQNGKDELALKNFKIACLGKDFKVWDDQKCAFEGDPAISNARGCYLASAVYAKAADTKSEKSALKCACDKKYAPACVAK
jgi:hypothetical protein